MSFNIENDVVRIACLDKPSHAIPELVILDNLVKLVPERLKELGFKNIEIVPKPVGFFRRAYTEPEDAISAVNAYLLVLRSVITPYVTLPEQQKHAAIINVWTDVFTHRIPTDTKIQFSPTLTMVAVDAIKQ